MPRRSLSVLADFVEDRLDKDQTDATFDTFVQNMLVLTMQEIQSYVPYARWLLDEVELTVTVNGTQYIVMPQDLDIDSLVSIRDEVTNKRVVRISPQDADHIDPGRDLTGDEVLWWYQRVEIGAGGPQNFQDRIYFLNRPDSSDLLRCSFGISSTSITSGTFPIPEKYEWILIEGALAKCWERVDPLNIAARQISLKNFERGLAIIRRDADTSPLEETTLVSHRPSRVWGITGASFPSNFDITP